MRLIRDVLDNQVVDGEKNKVGRVDGLVIELRGDEPPRVLCIEMGAPVLARRLHPRLGQWLAAFWERLEDKRGEVVRIYWSSVRGVGIDVEVDLGAPEREAALAWEQWIRGHIIDRIPGSG